MKKKMMALLLSAVTVLSAATLTGCGQKASDGDSNSADGSSGQPVELTLSLWDEAQLPTIQENVDAFNAAHEGSIKVTVEQIPWDTYWTKLDASLETKEAPDVFWMNTYVKKYVDAGVLESLDSYIADENYDMSVYAQGRVDAFTVDGQEYALPKGLDSVAVALNTGLFEKYGVELPQDGWTWDDMRSVATELKDAIAAAGGSEYPIVMELDSQPSWMNFLYQNGGSYLSEDGKTCNVALPESKDAIQQVDTATVTYAVRDTSIGDKQIKEGNILGMLNDEIEVVAEDVMEGTKELLRNAITEESEVVSIYYGADTAEEDAKELSAFIEEEFPDCEVEVQDGGQPLYYYIISIE